MLNFCQGHCERAARRAKSVSLFFIFNRNSKPRHSHKNVHTLVEILAVARPRPHVPHTRPRARSRPAISVAKRQNRKMPPPFPAPSSSSQAASIIIIRQQNSPTNPANQLPSPSHARDSNFIDGNSGRLKACYTFVTAAKCTDCCCFCCLLLASCCHMLHDNSSRGRAAFPLPPQAHYNNNNNSNHNAEDATSQNKISLKAAQGFPSLNAVVEVFATFLLLFFSCFPAGKLFNGFYDNMKEKNNVKLKALTKLKCAVKILSFFTTKLCKVVFKILIVIYNR